MTMMRLIRTGAVALALLTASGGVALAQDETTFNKGVEQFNAKNYDAAARSFGLYLQAHPGNKSALKNRGLAYLNLKEYDLAVADLERVVAMDPSYDNLVQYANALDSSGQYLRSVPVYERAIALDPNNYSAWRELGVAHAAAKNFSKAADAYGKAVERKTTDFALRSLYSDALYDAKRFPEALASYRAQEKMNTRDAPTLRMIGNSLVKTGDLPGALAAFDRGLALTPNDYQMNMDKGDALFNSKDFAGSIPLYRKATQVKPTSAIAHEYLGDALRLSKDYAAARTSYETALKLDARLGGALKGLIPILKYQGETEAGKARLEQLRAFDKAGAEALDHLFKD
jgi:tetratricopeptide (TPR) repeat protein